LSKKKDASFRKPGKLKGRQKAAQIAGVGGGLKSASTKGPRPAGLQKGRVFTQQRCKIGDERYTNCSFRSEERGRGSEPKKKKADKNGPTKKKKKVGPYADGEKSTKKGGKSKCSHVRGYMRE